MEFRKEILVNKIRKVLKNLENKLDKILNTQKDSGSILNLSLPLYSHHLLNLISQIFLVL